MTPTGPSSGIDDLVELTRLAAVEPGAAVARIVASGGPAGGDGTVAAAVAVARSLWDGARLASAAAVVSGVIDHLAGRPEVDDSRVELVRLIGEIYSHHGRPEIGIELCRRLGEPTAFAPRVDHLVVVSALHRDAGDLTAARLISDQLIALLDKLPDPSRKCRILNNRGVLGLDTGRLEEAAGDFEAARRLAAVHGLVYEASSCMHNLGVARARQGKVHEAFKLFDESLRTFGDLGSSYAMLVALADRVAVLYDVGLLTDARAAAELSVASHRRFDSRAGLEASLDLQVCIEVADGDWGAAVSHCHELLGLLEHRPEAVDRRVAVQQKLDLLRSLAGEAQLFAVDSDARELAADLEPSTAIEIGLQCIRDGRDVDAERLFTIVLDRSDRPAETLHRCVASARLAANRGDRVGALRTIEDGYTYAVVSGSCLGPSDLRSTTLRRVHQLGEIGFGIARNDGDVALAADLLNRACAITTAPEPNLSEREVQLLNRLRKVHHDLRRSDLGTSRRSYLSDEVVRIERELTAVRRSQPADLVESIVPAVWPVVGDRRTSYLGRHGDNATAIVMDGDDGVFVELGPFDALVGRVSSLLVMLDAVAAGLVEPSGLGPARDGLRDLLAPLLSDDPTKPMVVVADARVPLIPWSLVTSEPVSLMPSLGADLTPTPTPLSPASALSVVIGPDLPFADQEFDAIVGAWPGAQRVGDPLATVDDTRRALQDHELVHVSAHGRFRHDNPLFSEVLLADGPLTLYALIGLPLRARHVVFAACEFGNRSVGSPLGAFAVLQTCGCRSMIAGVGRVRDSTMSALMGSYYQRLGSGVAPAAALALAQRELVDDDPSVAQIVAFGPA